MRRRALYLSAVAALSLIGAIGAPIASAADDELLPNPSFEVADPAVDEPQTWNQSFWGSEPATWTPTFEYVKTEGHTGTHSVKVTITDYASPGDAKWTVDPWPEAGIPVTGGAYYTFSDWYKSNAETKVLAWYALASDPAGSPGHWATLSTGIPAAGDWTQYTTGFTMPAGATHALFVHVIAGTGYLQTDDYSMKRTVEPAGFTHPLISLTFDDGLACVLANAIGPLNAKGFPSTQYIPTGNLYLGDPSLMSAAQVGTLAAAGHEIGSHTVSHLSLLGLTPDQITTEVKQSQDTLELTTGEGSVVDLAYPYGDSGPAVAAALQTWGYRSGRTITPGYNDAAFKPYELRVQNMTKDTTQAEFESWVTYAKAHNYWLVIAYHGVKDVPGDYDTTPSAFQAQLEYLSTESQDANVVTVRRALDVVTNHFPTGTVKIVPAAAGTNGVLTAVPAFTDPDAGDTLSYSFQWFLGGAAIPGATGDTLDLSQAGHGDHGDTVGVRVTASDTLEGVVTAESSVTVANTAPTAGTVAIAPAAPRVGSALTAKPAGFADADGDTLTYTYAWQRNGAVIAGQAAAILPGSLFRAGDTIRVQVRAGDGHGGTSGIAAASVKVPGTAPSPPADTVEPTIVVKSPKAKTYRQGRKLTIRFLCTDSSGIAQWTATLRRRGGSTRTVKPGKAVKLYRAGRYILRITATDAKGNAAVKTVRFRVVRN